MSREYGLYVAHLGFWATMLAGRWIGRGTPDGAGAPVAEKSERSRFALGILWIHTLAFGTMYWGIGQHLIGGDVPSWFPGQRVAGTLVILLGAVMVGWSLAVFRSWRLRAQVDAGHELVTGGPFRLVRHPIYLAMNLLALGSAIWIPVPTLWIAFLLMVAGSDLRARAEERVLVRVFGSAYEAYRARTRRFIPGFY